MHISLQLLATSTGIQEIRYIPWFICHLRNIQCKVHMQWELVVNKCDTMCATGRSVQLEVTRITLVRLVMALGASTTTLVLISYPFGPVLTRFLLIGLFWK